LVKFWVSAFKTESLRRPAGNPIGGVLLEARFLLWNEVSISFFGFQNGAIEETRRESDW
jgi:hypothetical protein